MIPDGLLMESFEGISANHDDSMTKCGFFFEEVASVFSLFSPDVGTPTTRRKSRQITARGYQKSQHSTSHLIIHVRERNVCVLDVASKGC